MVFGAPRAIAQAAVMPEIAVNVVPEFTEWNRPASVDTQTSPVMLGLTTTLKGAVEDPSEPLAAKVTPPFVDR